MQQACSYIHHKIIMLNYNYWLFYFLCFLFLCYKKNIDVFNSRLITYKREIWINSVIHVNITTVCMSVCLSFLIGFLTNPLVTLLVLQMYCLFILFIYLLLLLLLLCVCVYIRGGKVHVFVPNRHGTGISVRCMRPYDKYRQFPPNPEVVMQRCLITASRRTANAVSCALETKPPRPWPCAGSERVSHMDWQRLALSTVCEMELCARVSYLSHSALIQIFPYLRCNVSECETIIYYANDRLVLQSHTNSDTEVGALMFGSLYFILMKYHQCCQVSNAGTDVCMRSGAITSTVIELWLFWITFNKKNTNSLWTN